MGSVNLDETVEKILNGEGLQVNEFDSAPEQVTAVALRKTVCYIVSAVIFNSKKEVLMVQEAKKECYGRWYLPAGRMEEGESIEEAMRREVKEEAGLDCQPITLLLVQEQGSQWIRFTFLSEVTGGCVKTPAQADAESLQAAWWDGEAPLALRSRDILSLIKAGLRYCTGPWFPALRPVDLPCHAICQRLLVAFTGSSSHDGGHVDLWLLLANDPVESGGDPHLPVSVSTVTWAAHRLVRESMPSLYCKLYVKTWGILGVQHNGRVPGATDGICFNMLVSVDHPGNGEETPGTGSPPPVEGDRYRWHRVENPSLRVKILHRMRDGSLLPVHSLY